MNRAALVTGGGVRVGRVIAERLAREGFSVAVHYNRSAEAAAATVALITQAGGTAAAVQADLASAHDVDALIPAAAAALGRPLCALINNASTFENDAVGELTRSNWDHHFETNLRAPVFLAQAFAGQAPADADAAIVNIIDQRVLKPDPRFFSYALSKAGLRYATTTLAQALAPRIRVNAVAPGPTLRNPRQSEADWVKQSGSTLLGRGSPPDAIADAVIYFVNARSVTGQMLAVDGGQHLAWLTPDIEGIVE